MNIGLLLIRLVVGGLFVGHGTQKLFGWFGGNGLEGTGGWLASLGYGPGRRMAMVAGVTETGGGLLLILGLLTPLGSAAIIGMMVAATLSVHIDRGLWNSNGGYELPLVFAVAALAMAFAGPGSFSLDNAFGLANGGSVEAIGALIVGAGTALLLEGLRRGKIREDQAAADEEGPGEERPAA